MGRRDNIVRKIAKRLLPEKNLIETVVTDLAKDFIQGLTASQGETRRTGSVRQSPHTNPSSQPFNSQERTRKTGSATTYVSTERELQEYISNRLNKRDIANEMEVSCGVRNQTELRADIVTIDSIIEVKLYLTRDNLQKALGQARLYESYLNKPKIKLMGLRPSNEKAYTEAKRYAHQIESAPGSNVKVVFLTQP